MPGFDTQARRAPAAGPAPAHLARVLVVDDERHSVDAIRRTLEDHYVVDVAYSAAEAQMLLETRPGEMPVDVILCDQRMPGTTGIEFLKQVRRQWPAVARVVISGYTEAEDIVAGINEAGIHQYVLKPWLPDQLVALVGEVAQSRPLQGAATGVATPALAQARTLQQRLDAFEAAVLKETLLRHRWDMTHAAQELGLPPYALRQKLERFGLEQNP